MRFFRYGLSFILALVLAAGPLQAALESWSPVPIGSSTGIPGRLIATSDPQIYYAFQTVRSLHRSADGGHTWSQLPVPFLVLGLEVDPRDPDHLLAASYDQMLRSADGGRNWDAAWIRPEGSSWPIGTLFSSGSRLAYFATRTALWTSDDAGVSFTRSAELPDDRINVEFTEGADGTLYLRRSNSCGSHGCGPDPEVYRSRDGGRTVTRLALTGAPGGRIVQVLAPPSRPESLYLRVEGEDFSFRLLRSVDHGDSVVDLGPLPVPGSLGADPSRPAALYVFGRSQLWRSTDGAASWQQLSLPQPGLDFRQILFAGGRIVLSEVEVVVPDSQFYPAFVSDDESASWTAIGSQYGIPASSRELVQSGPRGHLYLGGYQDLWRSTDQGRNWIRSLSPRLLELAGDPLRDDTLYGWGFDEELLPWIFRSLDGGYTFEPVYPLGSFARVKTLLTFALGGATGVAALLENGQLLRSLDGGDHWTRDLAPLPGGQARLFQLASDGAALYGIDGDGELFGSLDGGESWSNRGTFRGHPIVAGGGVMAGLDPFLEVKLVVLGPGMTQVENRELPFAVDPSRVELHVDGSGSLYLMAGEALLRSRDLGATWQTLSPRLPPTRGGLLENSILADASDPDHLYLAGLTGLYEATFPGSDLLALNYGRFAARLRWRAHAEDPWKAGPASSLTDQIGVFRLFTPERAEVAVQVLDGRPINGRFWVFVASMTDVALELDIRDQVSGELWTYRQAPGEARSTADLEAFPLVPEDAKVVLPLAFGAPRAIAGTVLLKNRFEVRLTRPQPDPVYPLGRQISGDTAGFTFFDPGAFDVLINVIDGQALNGHFWVFGGSLTDQEFTIEIRDTTTGKIWRRYNPPGAFVGFGDTGAL